MRRFYKTKFNNVKTQYDGKVFDSRFESVCYAKILNYMHSRKDFTLETQKKINIKVCDTIIDFEITFKSGDSFLLDAKGLQTPLSRIKYKLVKYFHGKEVVLIKKLEDLDVFFKSR